MYSNEMVTRAIDYQKTLFDNSFTMLAAFQDQGSQLVNQTVEKAGFIPDGSKQMYSYWNDFLKQNQDSCKAYVDKSFDRFKALFAPAKEAPAKPAAKKKAE